MQQRKQGKGNLRQHFKHALGRCVSRKMHGQRTAKAEHGHGSLTQHQHDEGHRTHREPPACRGRNAMAADQPPCKEPRRQQDDRAFHEHDGITPEQWCQPEFAQGAQQEAECEDA